MAIPTHILAAEDRATMELRPVSGPVPLSSQHVGMTSNPSYLPDDMRFAGRLTGEIGIDLADVELKGSGSASMSPSQAFLRR